MTQPSSNRRAGSFGSLLVIILVLGFIWWRTGEAPVDLLETMVDDAATVEQSTGSAPADAEPQVNEPAVASDAGAQDDAGAAVEASSDPGDAQSSDGAAQQTRGPTESRSGLPLVMWDQLPPEAHDTIGLIDQGGPFPYNKDGSTFQNREGLLPDHPMGYYKEYTVITPGSPDRGARRIVGGAEGELYYTDDHYASFREVVR